MKPIIFSSVSVRAIVEERKTQTRRVMKPANPFKSRRMGGYSQGNGLWVNNEEGYIKDYSVSACWLSTGNYIRRYAPYKPGDILWVRETWNMGFTETAPCQGDDPMWACPDCYRWKTNTQTLMDTHPYKYLYKATPETYAEFDDGGWRPSIHMPRAAARIFLRVTDVRVERVQDISEDDCYAEGVIYVPQGEEFKFAEEEWAIFKYANIWSVLNAKRDGGIYAWEHNPWVYPVTFERITKEGAYEVQAQAT